MPSHIYIPNTIKISYDTGEKLNCDLLVADKLRKKIEYPGLYKSDGRQAAAKPS